jgi:hypothetical protein
VRAETAGAAGAGQHAHAAAHAVSTATVMRALDALAPMLEALLADAVMAQGARDIEQGKTDTDCYDAAGPRFDRKAPP